MKFIDLYPTNIVGKVLNIYNTEDINSIKKLIQSEKYINEGSYGYHSINQKVLEYPLLNPLKKSILKLSKEYLNKINHKFEDIQISSSWINILNKDQKIQNHDHSNSYISGVYYLNKGSNIVFYNPLDNLWSFKPDFIPNSKFNIEPKPNLLLIFPSFLRHSVNPSIEDDRYSIAFNIIPKGEFGPTTSKLYL